jgi:hypothetical protein
MRDLFVQTNEEKHQTEHKDIKDFEAVEKKEIHETKQVRFHSYFTQNRNPPRKN